MCGVQDDVRSVDSHRKGETSTDGQPPDTAGPHPTPVTHSLTQCASPIVPIQILTVARPPHRYDAVKIATARGPPERRFAILVRLVEVGAGRHQLRVVCVMHESTRAAAQNDVEYAINGYLTDIFEHV